MSNIHRQETLPAAILVSLRNHSLKMVCQATGLSRSTIYRRVADGEFPKPVKISKGRVAWRERDLLSWLESR